MVKYPQVTKNGQSQSELSWFLYVSTNGFYMFWLVVSNIFYFPFHIWDGILSIDELIFFKMVF